MKDKQIELQINYDEFNKQSMLDGLQIEMLEKLHQERSPEVFNIIAIYYLYKKYWSEKMLKVVKDSYSDLLVDIDGDGVQILEKLNPKNFYINRDWDWEKLKKIIEIMKEVRSRVKKDKESNLINNN